MIVLHISDLHFGKQSQKFTQSQLKSAFINFICEQVSDVELYLLITGDIIYSGNEDYYKDASAFFDNIFSETKLQRKNVLLCPGNHDIVQNSSLEPFLSFDAFAAGIRNDNKFSFSKNSCQLYQADSITFLGINSAFKLDYKYGLIDKDEIKRCLDKADLDSSKIKIAFFHHHFLNVSENDTSAIRNAYELISLLDCYGFQYLFHGHQHLLQTIEIGKNHMKSFGGRTAGFSELVDGINLYDIGEAGIKCKNFILADGMNSGIQGIYFKQNIAE